MAEGNCDSVWKNIYEKMVERNAELEEIMEEHKDHMDQVRKLVNQGWKLMSYSNCQELCQQASWLLIGYT